MKKFLLVAAVLSLSATSLVAGPFGRMRERAAARYESRQGAEIVVTKDGTAALRWADGSLSPIGKDKKTGELIAAPKSESVKTLKQPHGPAIKVVPGTVVK